MLAFIPYNLRRLGDFSERQTRALFWPWVGVLYLLVTLAGFLAAIPMIFEMITRVQKFVAEHPEQVTEVRTATSYSMQIDGYHPELMPDFSGFLFAVAATSIAFIVLIAAAVVRRLHDCDRVGWWGLLPVPFLLGGYALMATVLSDFTPETFDPTDFLLLFVNNLIYLATLIYLVVLLAKSGTAGANRYGPPSLQASTSPASPGT